MPNHLGKGWSGWRREHYSLECVADALFLAVLKLPQSNLVVKDIAEVDDAGRYIPFPLVCRWLIMPSRTPLGAYYIYQRRGYHSVRSLLRAVEGLKRRTGRSQIPRFSFVVKIFLISPIWVFCGPLWLVIWLRKEFWWHHYFWMHCLLFVFVELHFIIVEKSLKKFKK